MRLRKYLIEKALIGKTKDLNIIKKAFLNAYKNYKPDGLKGYDKYKWARITAGIEVEIADKINDLEFFIGDLGNDGTTAALVIADIFSEDVKKKPMLIQVYVDQEYMYEWFEGKQKTNFIINFLNPVLESVAHELVHVEQVRRLLKTKDPLEAHKITKRMYLKVSKKKKFKDEYDSYLAASMEVMAHAQSANLELKGYPAQLMLDWLRETDGMRQIADDSSFFENYYKRIKDNFPKVWKRFLKYLVQYLEKRAKKEKKNKKIQADYEYYKSTE